MSTMENIPNLERLVFFEGQRLSAADITAIQEYQRQMRWLHNRSLHTWGIVFGLDVTAQRGDRQVTVQPGLAIDNLGREILLNSPSTLPIPPIAGGPNNTPADRYLTISYIEDSDLTSSQVDSGGCGTSGATRLPETSLLRFQMRGETDPQVAFKPGLDIILASIQVQNCKLAAVPSPKERRDAIPANQPYIATGATLEGSTQWSNLKVNNAIAGIQVQVDTSAGGFGATPVYIAQVIGERFVSGGFMDGLTSIAQSSATNFTLQMILPTEQGSTGSGLYSGLMPLNPQSIFTDPATTASQHNWYVAWMGIEE